MFGRLSVAARAIVFVIIVSVSLVAIDTWRSLNARTVQLQEMDVATSNLARASAQHANDTFKEADTLLVGLTERIQYDGTGPAALERLHRLLVLRKSELTQLDGIYVYDKNGKWLVNASDIRVQRYSVADREYFAFHRDHDTIGPHISAPVKSRATGKWIIPISRRIDNPDGSFAGVASASIDIDFFTHFYQSFQIGRAGAISLVSDSGILTVRYPYDPSFIGRNLVNTDLFRSYKAHGPVGSDVIKSSVDGITRLYSFRRLDRYPLFVTAALSKKEVLVEWWHDTLLHSAGVLVLVALLAVFGGRLVRQIEMRTRAEAELVRARDALEGLNQTLERLALQDGLTGLANRRQFDLTLDNEFSRALRNASTLSLIMMDVDCFKQYNDIYGHTAGDECLRVISRAIQELTPGRPGDLAARYGGEEIAVLLPNTQVAGAIAVAEKIRQAISALQIEHSGNPAGIVTISAGVKSVIPTTAASQPGSLVHAADIALYQAKSGGRNRVCASEETAPA